ncbi:MAG: HDOD domain-containing protein [Rhodocyclaceae bacterium]|nr:HDOD domain-containing protein [Rhodocyclaceae bacterium]
MSLKQLVKRLVLGAEPEPAISDNPFPPQELPVARTPRDTLSQQTRQAILHRDEIIDRRGRIAGYRFYVRPAGNAPLAGNAFVDALKSEAVANLARRRSALLPITVEEWHSGAFAQFVAAGSIFLLDCPREVPPPAAWSEAVAAIQAAGAKVALRDPPSTAAAEAALPSAQMLLLDFNAYDLPRFERILRGLRQRFPDLQIAVDNVADWAERRLCVAIGADGCLGGFASLPDEEEKQDQIDQSRLVLIEMLNLLRKDADFADIAAVAKRDPGVSVYVIGMANSPMAGLAKPVASLDQAIMVLGREFLYRWLTISLFRVGSRKDRDETLLELALARARLLELLGQPQRPKAECEELFLVGLLSVMDALLGQPMDQVLARMTLPAAVKDVLLRSAGPYGRFLMLALALEKGRSEQAGKLAESLNIAVVTLEQASLSALAWAEEAMQFSRTG